MSILKICEWDKSSCERKRVIIMSRKSCSLVNLQSSTHNPLALPLSSTVKRIWNMHLFTEYETCIYLQTKRKCIQNISKTPFTKKMGIKKIKYWQRKTFYKISCRKHDLHNIEQSCNYKHVEHLTFCYTLTMLIKKQN